MIGIGSEAHLSDQMLSKRSFAILASLTSNHVINNHAPKS